MIDNSRFRRDDDLKCVAVSLKVGDQHFHEGLRAFSVNVIDRGGEAGGAAVGEIVARHRGDNDVAQTHY